MALVNAEPFDYKLKKLFWEKETTQKEIAEKLGWKQQYVSLVMKREPVDKKIIELCDALGYDIQISFKKKQE